MKAESAAAALLKHRKSSARQWAGARERQRARAARQGMRGGCAALRRTSAPTAHAPCATRGAAAVSSRCAPPRRIPLLLCRTPQLPCRHHARLVRSAPPLQPRASPDRDTGDAPTSAEAEAALGRALLLCVAAAYGSLTVACRYIFLMPGPPVRASRWLYTFTARRLTCPGARCRRSCPPFAALWPPRASSLCCLQTAASWRPSRPPSGAPRLS